MLGQNILIVDDEADIREVIERSLEGLELNILQAASGEEALDIIEVHNIQIILLDIMMTGLSGVEMLDKINTLSPQTSVIMISGYSEKAHIYQALKHNVFDFLEKPIDMDVLRKRVINAYEQLKLKYMVDMVVEHFLMENFNLNHEMMLTMDLQAKAQVLSQAVALIQIQNNKRQVA